MQNSALRKKFKFSFQEFFASIAKNFILAGRMDNMLFMSLLTALIFKNSQIRSRIYFIFLKLRPKRSLKVF